MQTPSPLPALRQARSHLLEHGDCPSGVISEPLARSWRRSLAAGLLPTGRIADSEHASGNRLGHLLARNHDLLAHSRPVMEYLFEQVRHSESMVILADKRGTLMHTLGDTDFLGKAERGRADAGRVMARTASRHQCRWYRIGRSQQRGNSRCRALSGTQRISHLRCRTDHVGW